MIARKQWLEQKIKSIETQLITFPEGKLYCTRNGNRTKWYHRKEHKSTYLPKKERKLAEQLAMKEYFLCLLDDMRDEKKAIEFYLQYCETKVNCAERFAKEKTGFRELLVSYPDFDSNLLELSSDSIDREIQQWLNTPYRKNPYFPEQLTHKTLSDYYVRSKSEAMIDTALHLKQIPFRYECELMLGNVLSILILQSNIRKPGKSIIGNILDAWMILPTIINLFTNYNSIRCMRLCQVFN